MGTDPNFSCCVVDTANFCISPLFQTVGVAVGFLHTFPIITIGKKHVQRRSEQAFVRSGGNAKAPLHSCSLRVLVWCKSEGDETLHLSHTLLDDTLCEAS